MIESKGTIQLRDATLREGRDVPGVSFSEAGALEIAVSLARAGVSELEIVAPARVSADIDVVRRLVAAGWTGAASGLIYTQSDRLREELRAALAHLDHVDLLMSVSPERAPHEPARKSETLLEALALAQDLGGEVGVGFPNSTQADPSLLCDLAQAAAERGANRITVYDTNGSGDPFSVRQLVGAVRGRVSTPVYFHGHNDLGMATANSLAAVLAGADGLDVTVNGIGDRAGNAALEQVAMCLHLRELDCALDLGELLALSKLVAVESGVSVYPLAPVVGELAFCHVSAGHLQRPDVFEAFDPHLVSSTRSIRQ